MRKPNIREYSNSNRVHIEPHATTYLTKRWREDDQCYELIINHRVVQAYTMLYRRICHAHYRPIRVVMRSCGTSFTITPIPRHDTQIHAFPDIGCFLLQQDNRCFHTDSLVELAAALCQYQAVRAQTETTPTSVGIHALTAYGRSGRIKS